jgi:hypothetical protein
MRAGEGESMTDVEPRKTYTEPFRWPTDRGRFPAHFVISYGWRQTVFYTPVVARKCVITTVRFGRSALGFYGIAAFRNDDDEPELRIGLGLVEIDAYAIGFYRRDSDDD